MTRHRPVRDLGGPLTDHDHVTELSFRRRPTALGASHRPTGAFAFGVGAVLNFVTNAVAIVLAAAAAFVLTGFAPLRRIEESGQSVRFGLGIAILVVVLVTIPLAWSVEQIIDRNDLTTGVEIATREWLGDDSGYEVLDVSLLTDAVEVRLAGTGDLPEVNDLVAQVNETAGRQVDLVVKVIEQKTLVPGQTAEAAPAVREATPA